MWPYSWWEKIPCELFSTVANFLSTFNALSYHSLLWGCWPYYQKCHHFHKGFNKSHGFRVNHSNSQFLSMTADPMTNLIFLQFNQCHIYPMTDLISLQFNQCHNAIEWKVTSLFQGSLFSLSLSFSFGWSGHVSSSITSNVEKVLSLLVLDCLPAELYRRGSPT